MSRAGERRPTSATRRWLAAGVALALVLVASRAEAVGVGAMVGTEQPEVALTAKSGLGSKATDLALSWSDALYVHVDGLLHLRPLGRKLPLYVGLGAWLRLEDDPLVGMRLPLGLALLPGGGFEVFFEVVPELLLYPDMERRFEPLNLGLGARYHFR